VRPADTGRSTNCLINDVGIYIHQKERGYHNYALPYSWDVRLGHKERDAALDELNDDLDMDRVRRTLEDVGYDENRLVGASDQPLLTAFYVSSPGIEEADLRMQLGERLPAPLVPALLVRMDEIPLTPHGKVDESALLRVGHQRSRRAYVAPEGPVEEYLAAVWQELLGADEVGASDNFFQLGGTSLKALELMLRLCREFDINLPLETVFTSPTVHDLARVAEARILDDVSSSTGEGLADDAGGG
jgi:acyl carrier protein